MDTIRTCRACGTQMSVPEHIAFYPCPHCWFLDLYPGVTVPRGDHEWHGYCNDENGGWVCTRTERHHAVHAAARPADNAEDEDTVILLATWPAKELADFIALNAELELDV